MAKFVQTYGGKAWIDGHLVDSFGISFSGEYQVNADQHGCSIDGLTAKELRRLADACNTHLALIGEGS
jgi:hypothetical protein